MYKIISYLEIPSFYLQIYNLYYPENKEKPVIIGGSPQEYGIVIEASPAAMAKGIRPGMLSFQAKHIMPDIEIIPPDQERYAYLNKKVVEILENFSIKWAADKYNSFFIFLPDYFSLLPAIKEIQTGIHKKWNLNTRAGLSDNKHIVRLASRICPVNDILLIDRKNAKEILSPVSISLIPELSHDDISKLDMAGVKTIHGLFLLPLPHIRFYLGAKGEHLYYNYICGIKTARDKDNFIFDELLFYDPSNDLKKITGAVIKRAIILLAGLNGRSKPVTINKLKVYIEYIDNKSFILSKKIKGENTMRAALKYMLPLFNKFKRRVRIKKIGLYIFYRQGESCPGSLFDLPKAGVSSSIYL